MGSFPRQVGPIRIRNHAHWLDRFYSPFINVSRKGLENVDQNPLVRFFLEETVITEKFV